ncbi:MAG: hypothetical protein IJP03_04010 [Christensenellaceae bacterium]|nr:hypothetical protein [Christensenellaceae bacterium]
MERRRFSGHSHRVSLTAMFAALSLIFLYLSAILPTGRLAMYFLSSIFVAGLLVEHQPALAALLWVIVSGLGLLIVPNLLMVLPYALLFGHYGIGKYFIEKLRDKVTAFVLKLIYFNVFFGAVYLLAGEILLGSLMEKLQLWMVIALVQVAFVVYDFLYSRVVLLYERRIRPLLLRS